MKVVCTVLRGRGDSNAALLPDWTMTKWTGDYKDYDRKADNKPDGSEVARVVRGGSFDTTSSTSLAALTATATIRDLPRRGYGFRLVASPIF